MTAYTDLEAIFARASVLHDVIGILSWDMETMMPRGSIEGRSEQLAALEDLSHETLTAPAVGDLLGAAEAEGSAGSDWQKANLREMERAYRRAVAVPRDLLLASIKANTLCQHAWQSARKDNDFAAVKPHLAEVVRLRRETGLVLGEALEVKPYDALLDQFDPGADEAGIDRLFAPVRERLPGLIERAVAKQNAGPALLPIDGPFPVDRQEKLCRLLLEKIGFDFDRGRIDTSAHPFSGGAFGDVRVTTRFAEDVLIQAFMATIHEGGHALYEQGRPREWRSQPVGVAKGMAIHESQSMIMEWQAGKNDRFLAYFTPLVRDAFGDEGPAWSDENLRRAILRVEPGFIRVNSDELTYPAHILVRYEIEKALMSGDLTVDDLPGAFNDAVRRYLGLTVPDHRRGCLQDIHWYGGAFGYFPMYLAGAMIAAQLFVAAKAAVSGLETALGEGDFRPLVGWLREHIHSRASFHDRDDLVREATGAPANADAFLRHLETRYVL